MNDYFRVTVYHPESNISAIMDSYGMFEKLWQFTSFLVKRGFRILEVSNAEKFLDGNIKKVKKDPDHILLRAAQEGVPDYVDYEHNGKTCKAVKIEDKIYIPDCNL